MTVLERWQKTARTTWHGVVLALALTTAARAAEPVTPVQASAPIRIGVLAFMGAEAAVHTWSSVRQQLERRLPGHPVELALLDHAAIDDAVARQALDFVITNPGHYVSLETRWGAARMLTLQVHDDSAAPHTQGVGAAVVVLHDRPDLQTLGDLRHRRVAIVGQQAFAGYQLVWRELDERGIKPTRDLAELITVGLPMDRVLEAVASGAADAGFVRACLIESNAAWRERFRVLAPRTIPGFDCASSTRIYPNWPIATLRGTDPALARAVAIALLEMPPGQGAISWSVPDDYQSVHELQRQLMIGPYADLRTPGLQALARKHWPWLAGLLALIVLGGVYTFHVERQVQRRTKALRAALRDREALELHLRESREQAEHMGRLSVLGELSGTLAHELNQPLAAIGNYAQSLARRVDNHRLTPEAVAEAASEISGQAERAAGILGRIRAFARKRVAQRQRIDPLALTQEAVALFRGMLVDAPTVDIDNQLPAACTIDGDALQIQQVLLNLLKNAFDATRALPPERRRLRVRLACNQRALHIGVRDLGEPLSDEQRQRLFEPFFTTKDEGMGLGLAICRSIAEAHGGRLTATAATDGPGLWFNLTLPAA